jgi:hypothetical protein
MSERIKGKKQKNDRKTVSRERYAKLCQLIIGVNEAEDRNGRDDIEIVEWGVPRSKDGGVITFKKCKYVVIIHRMDKANVVRSIYEIIRLPFVLSNIKKAALKEKIIKIKIYAVYPSANNPFLLYTIKSAASRYVEENVILDVPNGFKKIVYDFLSKCIGCYPTADAILLIGMKSDK